ncbi:MAG: MASE1 domain-containing protein [Limisphaerales bacterium]
MAYLACAAASTLLSVRGTVFISFWLPGGLYVAVLLLNPRRDWLWLCLATLPASLTFDLLHGTKFILILFFFCANTVQAVAGAWVDPAIRNRQVNPRHAQGVSWLAGFCRIVKPHARRRHWRGDTHGFGLKFVICEFVGLWWADNAMAVLVLSPFILIWFSKPDANPRRFIPRGRMPEAICLLVVLIGCAWHLLFFHEGIMSVNKSWILLPLLWAGLRFGPRGATAANLLMSMLLAYFTTQFFKGLTPEQIVSGEYVFVLQSSLAGGGVGGIDSGHHHR